MKFKRSRKLPPGGVFLMDPGSAGGDRSVATVVKIEQGEITMSGGTLERLRGSPDAFVAWADGALKDASARVMKHVLPSISDGDYVYLANEQPRTQAEQVRIESFTYAGSKHEIESDYIPLPEHERQRLVNGDWSLPEAPPVTTRPIDDPESEEYRVAAFKSEWADLIGLFNIAGTDSPMADTARRSLNAKLASKRVTYAKLATMDPTLVLDTLAPKHILKPAKLPTGPFGPSVTAESEADLADMLAHLRADPVLSAKMRGAGYLVTSAERVKL